MRRTFTDVRLCACILATLALAGCEDDGRLETHPVAGRILINGTPAAGCVVTFVPLDPALKDVVLPAATASEDGSFALTTYESGDGAPAGEYGVALRWEANSWPGRDADRGVDPVVTMKPDRLLERYASPEKSGLKATVKEGENVLEPFRLDGVRMLKGAQ